MISRRATRRVLVQFAAGLLLAEACATSTFAQTAPDDWKFQAILYGYLPQISGTATFPTGATPDINVNTRQIISSLKFAFMGYFDARKGPWGAFTDIIYVSAGASKSGTRNFSIPGVMIPASLTADAHLDVRSSIWTLGASYTAARTPEGTLDVFAGARQLSLKTKLDWQFSADIGPIGGPGRQGSVEVTHNDWDGIVGAKGRLLFGDRREWFVAYYADVGTGDSQLTYQWIAGLGYSFSWGDVIGAWRYLDYRFSGGNRYALSGPAIGVAFHW